MLGSEDQRKKALKNAKKLKELGGYTNIYINRDLTPLEQEKRRALVEEMRQKKAEAVDAGRKDTYFIKNEQVVLGRPANQLAN